MGGGAVLRSKAKAKAPAVATDGWNRSDWSEDEKELLVERSPPRGLEFGKVATFDEAREATGDLADFVDKLCLSSANIPVTHCEENKHYLNDALSEFKSSALEVDGIDPSRSNVILPSPEFVINALSLFKEPGVHTAVESVFADGNVWDAVMNNAEVQEFFNSHQQSRDTTIVDDFPECSATQSEKLASTLKGFMNTTKSQVSKMANGFTDLVQNYLYTPPPSEKHVYARTETETAFESNRFLPGAMAIAVAVIMIVVFKRI